MESISSPIARSFASRRATKRLSARTVLRTCFLLLLGTVLYCGLDGLSYYTTPKLERPRHERYWELKPGGRLGIVYGEVGAGMMLVLLLYSVRKRVRFLRRLGTLRVWLDFHILLGIFGPLFILLHTSFKVGGIVALSFWSMVAIALSGLFGRYLYTQIPRTRAGDELTLAQVERQDQQLSTLLRTNFGLPEAELEELETLAGVDARRRLSIPVLAVNMVLHRWLLRFRLARFRWRYRSVDRRIMKHLQQLLLQKVLLHRRLLLWDQLRRLFYYWHVFHKPLAFVMYTFMFIHIGVAWWTGYGHFGG